jgi:DNA-binding CsgD family transcriptional regulator
MQTGRGAARDLPTSGNDVGLLILDSSHTPVASTPEALRVLAFPNDPSQIQNPEVFIRHKIGSDLVLSTGNQDDHVFVFEFRSGKRRYICTTFNLQAPKTHPAQISVALLLERSTRTTIDLARVATQYGLTPRESELVQNLLLGLTSKEIAARMKVSASTVNAFLHLVMVKMGARTRSGVVRQIVCPER